MSAYPEPTGDPEKDDILTRIHEHKDSFWSLLSDKARHHYNEWKKAERELRAWHERIHGPTDSDTGPETMPQEETVSEQEWWTNWYVTRRHIAVEKDRGYGPYYVAACCGAMVVPDNHHMRSTEWQQNRLADDPPKCGNCLRFYDNP